MKVSVSFFLLFFCASIVMGQIDISGTWDGAIEIPNLKLQIIIRFTKEKSNFQGGIDIPKQNAKNLPLTEIKIEKQTISFKLPAAPGNARFHGKIEKANSIKGSFKQSGLTFPFHLTKRTPKVAKKQKKAEKEKRKKIEHFIKKAMELYKVPGVAVGVIKDNKIFMLKGFGYRNVEKKLPVTPKTLFGIGSTTKAFTTMTIGMLVDDGLLNWDTPVKTYLPEFQLHDEYASNHTTPLDMVTHRTGLPRHDLMWYSSPFSREEIFKRLKHLPFSKPFRYTFQYQNHMYMTAGYLVGKVSKKGWEGFVKERIFQPLKMTNSNFSIKDMVNAKDFSKAYHNFDGTVKVIPFRNIDNVGPAGSINSSVEDMIKWLSLHLNKGKIGEKRLISKSQITKMHTVHVSMNAFPKNNENILVGYGLGWAGSVYKGHYVAHHGGGIDGFITSVGFLPFDNIGIVVLSNLNSNPLPGTILFHIVDVLLEKEETDYYSRLKQAKKMMTNMKKQVKPQKLAKKNPTTHALKDFVGIYKNKGYGTLSISLKNKTLEAKYNGFEYELKHFNYNIFHGKTKQGLFQFKISFQFMMDSNGDIAKAKVALALTGKKVIFAKEASKKFTSKKYLKTFIGVFQFTQAQVKIYLYRGKLFAHVKGQPHYELVPTIKHNFKLKKLPGYTVEFILEKGKVTKAIFRQPNGVFTAIKK